MARISINLSTGTVAKQEPTKAKIVAGIDLGTTNSLIAYMKEGNPVCLRGDNQKHTLVPSIVHFTQEGAVLVGDSAKEMLTLDPANTIFSVKRLMGKSYQDVASIEKFASYKIINEDDEKLVKVQVRDRFYTPIELSAKILESLKNMAEQALDTEIARCVITVPAYFNDSQRQATRDAGKLAGLDVLRIINEPTAASLAYGLGLDKEISKTIAVYDLGGGTFDISVLRIEDGVFEVLSTNGDTFLGGDDFDNAILSHWEQMGWAGSFSAGEKQALRLLAERAKKEMSLSGVFCENFLGKTYSINASDFQKITSALVESSINCCKNALKDASLSINDIDEVVMVGGSTRMKVVKEAVSSFFGKPLYDSLNPDEVVALGAAVQADILAGNNKEFLLLDVTPLSLGIETIGGLMDTLIPRNSKIPTSLGRNYTTSKDGQTSLKVAVHQGERDMVADNRKLGEFLLKGIPPMPAGLPKIEIQFLLDADGILKVKAKELRSGVEQSVVMRSQFGLGEEEMAKMLLESIQHAKEDMQRRSLIEAQTEARMVLLATDKFLSQNDAILSTEEKIQIKALAKLLNESVNSNDKDAILAAQENLNTYSSPLAHRAMDITIGGALKDKAIG